MALNSGLCWGPREWAKRPGHVVMEFLEPIPPGLNRRAFMARLENEIEAATDKLVEEERERQRAGH
jgi:1-acyl-sn-glycerol-3-phosphate acyltransferase